MLTVRPTLLMHRKGLKQRSSWNKRDGLMALGFCGKLLTFYDGTQIWLFAGGWSRVSETHCHLRNRSTRNSHRSTDFIVLKLRNWNCSKQLGGISSGKPCWECWLRNGKALSVKGKRRYLRTKKGSPSQRNLLDNLLDMTEAEMSVITYAQCQFFRPEMSALEAKI